LKTIVLFVQLAFPQTGAVKPEPKFQAPVPPTKRFWLRLQPSKTAWAPSPQPWCSGYVCVGVLEIRLQAWTVSKVNQCQLIENVGFVKGLTPSLSGTLNICSRGKSFSQEKLVP